MFNPNARPHPEKCNICFENDRPCTWIVFESTPKAVQQCCDQCARRNLYCEWPDLPATDANGDILVDAPDANPYIPGRANETDAARRARVGSWTTKPDKPRNPKLHAKWREDLFIWNNRGNTPLPATVPVTPASKYRARPPPKGPPATPKASDQSTSNKVPPIKIPETPPPVPMPFSQPHLEPITPAQPVQNLNSNIVDLEPSLPGTPPAEPVVNSSLNDVIDAFIKKYGDVSNAIWFTEKIDLKEEICRVGCFKPKISPSDSTVVLTKSMINSVYEHWAEFDPHSEKESSSRACLIRTLKMLVAHHFMYPSFISSDDSNGVASSSADKGKKRAYNQD
ncbi:uncharacterized protein MELLADRAFT_89535 [Melampsora larici-populina 98AG31]|uniref:Zn(2)-C6 fungal-type domain-containing protein n=1 Tax=Melampsora larici-populina (strain 98AG31 / pathotype 3-4-7) TaxID=747676 RepID=F4SE96_MELLP|nr:uncharacterized protein MELLADRAFT_89535 [Melampsora larici-populina 98AG31]EGF97031.1 hypothetical protein MELLADRAFT_89535 [Melampsora larici-populina 98AG31]